jgi:hypothetical protein
MRKVSSRIFSVFLCPGLLKRYFTRKFVGAHRYYSVFKGFLGARIPKKDFSGFSAKNPSAGEWIVPE